MNSPFNGLPTEAVMKTLKLFWQYPVITEKIFYQQNKNKPGYIGMPWATIIDRKYHPRIIYNLVSNSILITNTYTCCQHISFRNIIPLLQVLGIKTLYTPHKIKGEDVINGIVIKACPLYAVNIEDISRNNAFNNFSQKQLIEKDRKYLYSFQGAYDKRWYMTDVRQRLFDMIHPKNTYVKDIGEWHFDKIVYNPKQNNKGELNITENHTKNKESYNDLLLGSRYCLCPSGSGPNSIRFWEALAVGSIPILLSDTLDLPAYELNGGWNAAVILSIKEKDIESIPKVLENISTIDEKKMRTNCINAYNHFKNNYIGENLNESGFWYNGGEDIQELKPKREIIHYCCGSYSRGSFGGVARYDYQLSLAFPNRLFFEGPREKSNLLGYLKTCSNPLIITDNHLACDIPNEYDIVLVHHGVAKTHADREPNWNKYWRDLCCNGQAKMLEYRDPNKTKIISISQFCSDEFTRYYGDVYTRFEKIKILHSSELNERYRKEKWNTTPIVLGNWKDANKGKNVIKELALSNQFQFQDLQVHPDKNGIVNFNTRKQNIYLNADIFLQLSLCEGNSYSTLDALLCGLPVVSSDVGLFYKDVPENCYVKIDWTRNNDAKYVQSKLNEAWERRDELRNNGRQWYLNNCGFVNWCRNMKQYIESY